MKYIYFVIILISFLIFTVVTIYRVKKHDSNWINIEFEGDIRNITHLKYKKNSFVKVNDIWFAFSYNELFEDNNLVGLKIAKRKDEKGIWLERKQNSNDFTFKMTQGSIVNDKNIIQQLESRQH